MQVSSKFFDTIDLPLEKFESTNEYWPEATLRSATKPVLCVTALKEMACFAILFLAPKRSSICIAPVSSHWKHDEGIVPMPVHGGPLHLKWLGEIHRSKDMARRFKTDLTTAGQEKSKFRTGILPYQGGACMGYPAIGVSKDANLSPFVGRSYIIPANKTALERFVAEFENLYSSLDSAFIKDVGQNSISSQQWSAWASVQFGGDLEDSLLARQFVAIGLETKHQPLSVQTAHFAELRSVVSSAISEIELNGIPDFLNANPLLTDISIRLPIPSRITASLRRNLTPQEIAKQEKLAYELEYLCSLRARYFRLLEWPIFYLEAFKTLSAIQTYYRFVTPAKDIPYDIVKELTALSQRLEERYPILSTSFLESVWE